MESDKVNADGITTLVINADTEGLLQAPFNMANVMYFHSKLNVHNFTFHEFKSKQVMNYVWSEYMVKPKKTNNFLLHRNYQK